MNLKFWKRKERKKQNPYNLYSNWEDTRSPAMDMITQNMEVLNIEQSTVDLSGYQGYEGGTSDGGGADSSYSDSSSSDSGSSDSGGGDCSGGDGGGGGGD